MKMSVCNTCGLQFTSSVLLYNHSRAEHYETLTIKLSNGCEVTVRKNDDSKKFTCPVEDCFKEYSRGDSLLRHCTGKHTSASSIVEPLRKAYKLRQSNGNFVGVQTDTAGTVKCPESGCSAVYTRYSRLKKHYESHFNAQVDMVSPIIHPLPVSLPLGMDDSTPIGLKCHGLQVVSVEGLHLLVCKHCRVCVLPEAQYALDHVKNRQHQVHYLATEIIDEKELETLVSEMELTPISLIRQSSYYKPVDGNYPCAVPG